MWLRGSQVRLQHQSMQVLGRVQQEPMGDDSVLDAWALQAARHSMTSSAVVGRIGGGVCVCPRANQPWHAS
eukprot:12195531-Alexandrium_andersonii.AAC.1